MELSKHPYYHGSNSEALIDIDLLILSYWGWLHKWDKHISSLRVEVKTYRLLNEYSNQLNYDSTLFVQILIDIYWVLLHKWHTRMLSLRVEIKTSLFSACFH